MIQRIDKLLSRISVQRKLMIIFLGCALIPLFLQTFYSLSIAEDRLQAEILKRMESTLSDRAANISLSLQDTVNLSVKFNNDERVYQWLDRNYSSYYDYLLTYQEEIKTVTAELPYHLQVEDIVFYTDNPTLFNSSLVQKTDDMGDPALGETLVYRHDEWLDREEGQLFLRASVRPARYEGQVERQISIMRSLNYYPQYADTDKLVKINLSTAYFNRLLIDTEFFDSFHIVDSEQNIIFSTRAYNQSGMFETYDGQDLPQGVVGLEMPIGNYPLTLYGLYDSQIVSREFQKSRYETFVVSLIGLVIASVCIVFVGKNISNRTKKIVRQSQEIAKGNFIVSDTAQLSKDEIGLVEKSINDLSEQLQELIEKEYKAELNQARLESETNSAKLQALQSQVNPHFLFNALESIRLKAQVRNETETAMMIKYMSRMFRHVIDWTDEVVPIAGDVKFLEEFLQIQKYRFGDEFDYSIEVDPGAEALRLPKMIIQPLVENACVHGAESVSGRRFVTLRITRREGWLDIQVGDNGAGISEERLAEINRMLRDGPKTYESVGISNVYQRLKLYYGQAFSFQMESAVGKGTLCIVRIPLNPEEGM